MMGNLSQCRPTVGDTCFQSHLQFFGQTLAKKETLIASTIGIEMLSASLQADRVSRTLKFLWCTTEKKHTINTSIKPPV